MKPTYQAHFDVRGSAYDSAMRRFPLARRAEFQQAIAAAELQAGMVVADVPAGGGYLKSYLPDGCTWLGHEPCASFTNHGCQDQQSLPLLPLPWSDGQVDAAISLAGIHHVEDKLPVFSELFRVVRGGGRLVVSDVAAGSDVADFLDSYVGAHNSTGHQGVFLDEHTLNEMTRAGWAIMSAAIRDFHWTFANRDDMAAFCHTLFDLRTSSEADTRNAIETQLGVVDLPGGLVGMRWSLMTVAAGRAP